MQPTVTRPVYLQPSFTDLNSDLHLASLIFYLVLTTAVYINPLTNSQMMAAMK